MTVEIFNILLWISVVLLLISGVDDAYLDFLYWLLRGRYKSKIPDFTAMHYKQEKPVAIMLGAWNESRVIGRTLSYALRNLRYTNYRIFVGVYPNDTKTIDAVKEISSKDSRVIACVNVQDGPTTKADNLNTMYSGLCEFEKLYGEFEIILIHDAEDFIHPSSLKLYNFLLGHKGYHGIQIPVTPIKSRRGKIYHRTYCDAFAEIHTKDMIVRQGMGTFIPFSGTGMGFHRKAVYYLEMQYNISQNISSKNLKFQDGVYYDAWGRKIELTEEYFNNTEDIAVKQLDYNSTDYHDDPFHSLNQADRAYPLSTKSLIRSYSAAFVILLLTGVSFLIYNSIHLKNEWNHVTEINLLPKLFAEELVSKNPSDFTKTTIDFKYLKYNPGESGKYSFKNSRVSSEKTGGIISEDTNGIINIPFENAAYDKTIEVMYVVLGNGKIGIQESVWNSPDVAKNRLDSIMAYISLNVFEGFVAAEVKAGEPVYKVILGSYENIREARLIAAKIKKEFQN